MGDCDATGGDAIELGQHFRAEPFIAAATQTRVDGLLVITVETFEHFDEAIDSVELALGIFCSTNRSAPSSRAICTKTKSVFGSTPSSASASCTICRMRRGVTASLTSIWP